MEPFLDFLNSAEISELTKLPGLDNALAERIIAARPFEQEEDILKVNGLGIRKAASLKAAFEKSDQIIYMSNPTPARIPERILSDEPIAIQTGPAQSEKKKEGNKNNGVKRFFTGLLILLIILTLLGGLAAAVIYGVPYFYKTIIQPIEVNTLQIGQIATQQASDLSDMQTNVTELQYQIDDLKSRDDELALAIAAHTESLVQLESMQAELEQAQLDQQSSLLSRLEYDLLLTRSIELLSRANLYLSQSNYGLGKDDVHAAYSLLTAYETTNLSEEEQLLVESVLQRLELALNNLPAYPVVAANDVQIAWQLLVDGGLPQDQVPVPEFTPTLTPSPIMENTPTATPTPK